MNRNSHVYSVEELKRKCAPFFSKIDYIDKAYLFGSYASGKATPKSDIDIYLVTSRHPGIRVYDTCEDLKDLFQKDVDLLLDTEFANLLPENLERQQVLIYERKQ